MRLPNICGLLTASALLFGANSANALELTIDDLTNPGVEVELDDFATNSGVLSFSTNNPGSTVGDFAVVITSGLGTPNVGGPGEAEIDLSVQARSSGVDTLQITLTDRDLNVSTGANGIANLASSFSINASADGTLSTIETFISIGGGPVFEALSSFTGTGRVNFDETLARIISAGDTFDLMTVVTIEYSKLAFATLDANLNVAPVPLPAALPLFLTALVGLGFVGRRRHRQAA